MMRCKKVTARSLLIPSSTQSGWERTQSWEFSSELASSLRCNSACVWWWKLYPPGDAAFIPGAADEEADGGGEEGTAGAPLRKRGRSKPLEAEALEGRWMGEEESPDEEEEEEGALERQVGKKAEESSDLKAEQNVTWWDLRKSKISAYSVNGTNE